MYAKPASMAELDSAADRIGMQSAMSGGVVVAEASAAGVRVRGGRDAVTRARADREAYGDVEEG